MPTRRIFGYIGFIISLLIAYQYAFGRYHDPAEGLGAMIVILFIIIVVPTIAYIIGRVVEKKRAGTTTK